MTVATLLGDFVKTIDLFRNDTGRAFSWVKYFSSRLVYGPRDLRPDGPRVSNTTVSDDEDGHHFARATAKASQLPSGPAIHWSPSFSAGSSRSLFSVCALVPTSCEVALNNH